MSSLPRSLADHVRLLGTQTPAVIVTGPRQAGKTTLCRMAWPEHQYINLERPDLRERATDDPRGFLAQLDRQVILDEIQRVPELTSWLQVLIDEDPQPGHWILTGSEQLTLTERTSQSLAGRAAFVHLLPLDVRELQGGGALPEGVSGHGWTGAVLRGGYPAPLSQPMPVATWLANYVQSYVERDVRTLLAVSDLARFQDFLQIAAGASGQTTNLSRMGGAVGITHPTVRSWLSVLEATFVAFRLRPWHRNLGKRLTKSAKTYFWDSGLLCHLLRISDADQLLPHPLRGAIFESWVVAELLKMVHHRGERPDAWFYRDQGGLEVDLLLRRADRWLAIEVKSGSTVARDSGDNLRSFAARVDGAIDGLPVRPVVVYGGDERFARQGVEFLPWSALPSLLTPESP